MNPRVMIFALLGTLLLLTGMGLAGDQENKQRPLPFDPLTEEEKGQAIETSLENPTGDAHLSDRYEVIGASLHTEKAHKEMETWPRMAQTWVYDYEADHTVRTLVDLDEDTIENVEILQTQPPLTAEEKARSGGMALEDDRVQERLQEDGLERANVTTSARLWTGDEPTACPEDRCALVAFFEDDRYHADVFALVDLSEDTLRAVLELTEDGLAREGVPR